MMTNLPLIVSDISRSKFGFHLIEVLETREMDISEERMKNRARQILIERKFCKSSNLATANPGRCICRTGAMTTLAITPGDPEVLGQICAYRPRLMEN